MQLNYAIVYHQLDETLTFIVEPLRSVGQSQLDCSGMGIAWQYFKKLLQCTKIEQLNLKLDKIRKWRIVRSLMQREICLAMTQQITAEQKKKRELATDESERICKNLWWVT